MPVRVAEPDKPRLASPGLEETTRPTVGSTDLGRRREIGQFFTPPVVAGFVWDMLAIIQRTRNSKHCRGIDPSCGEGVFLRAAAERDALPAECLFGLDIDKTLSPVWRRDARLKGAHLLVANGLLDLPDRGVQVGTFDRVVGNPPFAGLGVRDLLRLHDDAETTTAVPETDLFGALVLQERPAPIGPPLTPLERAKLDQIAKALGRYMCWRLSKGTPENGEAEAADESSATGLFAGWSTKAARSNGSGEFDKAAEMVAAWPLNHPLDPKRSETRLLLRRLASTAIEVFFMERFLRLAKPGGLIAVIVPESIVASDQLAPLRTWLLTEMDLLAVVSLPQNVFAGVGANAKTSVIFARRLLRPKSADIRATAAPKDDAPDNSEDNGAGPKVLMAAPNTGAPGFSLEDYLATVLQQAREHGKRFPTEQV